MQYRAIRSLSAVVLSATLLALSSTASAQQKFINILTGGQTGVYYPLGVALAKLFGETIPGALTSVRLPRHRSRTSTCCSRARARSRSRSVIRCSDRLHGDKEVGFNAPLNKLRGIAAIYPNYIQVVATATPASRRWPTSRVNGCRWEHPSPDRAERAGHLGPPHRLW